MSRKPPPPPQRTIDDLIGALVARRDEGAMSEDQERALLRSQLLACHALMAEELGVLAGTGLYASVFDERFSRAERFSRLITALSAGLRDAPVKRHAIEIVVDRSRTAAAAPEAAVPPPPVAPPAVDERSKWPRQVAPTVRLTWESEWIPLDALHDSCFYDDDGHIDRELYEAIVHDHVPVRVARYMRGYSKPFLVAPPFAEAPQPALDTPPAVEGHGDSVRPDAAGPLAGDQGDGTGLQDGNSVAAAGNSPGGIEHQSGDTSIEAGDSCGGTERHAGGTPGAGREVDDDGDGGNDFDEEDEDSGDSEGSRMPRDDMDRPPPGWRPPEWRHPAIDDETYRLMCSIERGVAAVEADHAKLFAELEAMERDRAAANLVATHPTPRSAGT
jgi:hypothetical protein